MAFASPPPPRREKWPWFPVLFLRSKFRSAAPPPAARSSVDAETRDLLRLIASALPRCVAPEAGARKELEDISDRLEELASGLPEQEWANSVARDLASRRAGRAAATPIRVSWSRA